MCKPNLNPLGLMIKLAICYQMIVPACVSMLGNSSFALRNVDLLKVVSWTAPHSFWKLEVCTPRALRNWGVGELLSWRHGKAWPERWTGARHSAQVRSASEEKTSGWLWGWLNQWLIYVDLLLLRKIKKCNQQLVLLYITIPQWWAPSSLITRHHWADFPCH